MLGHGSGGESLPRRVVVIAGLLLAASAINYMDRQTLANASMRVKEEFSLTREQFGTVEAAFSYAFAVGSLLFGVLADRVNVRWLYPLALLAWSFVGFATGFALNYEQLLVCRTALGLVEAAHWPCALKTTQALLSSKGRTFGNGVLQSGTSIGAIVTPVFMWWIMVQQGQSWRLGFQVVGLLGVAWIIGWLATTRDDDFHVSRLNATGGDAASGNPGADTLRRWVAVLLVVVVINTVWQILRAWIPLILQEEYGYGETFTLWFTSVWYGVSDVGCLLAGSGAWWLSGRGMSVKWSRVTTFAVCCMMSLGLIAVPWLVAGPLLLAMLLAAGAGVLGFFPLYYSFTQDISRNHMGSVTGVASFFGWIVSAWFQMAFGKLADVTDSYSTGIAAAGAVTLVALAAWAILWPEDRVAPLAEPPA